MNDLRYAFRQLLKNPGFTVHPPQCCLPDQFQSHQYRFGRPGHPRQYCYGGRVIRNSSLSSGMNENTKNQAPNTRETPNLKSQAPKRWLGSGFWDLELQSCGIAAPFEIWELDFLWSLVFGIWCFVNSSIVNQKSQI
jgi:hypothetical protein